MKPAGGSFDGVELPNRGAVQEEDSERRRGSQQGGFDSYSGTVLAILVLGGIALIGWFAVSNWGGKSDSAPASAQDTCKSYACKQDGFVLKGEPEKIKGTMTDETCCEAKTAEQAKTADAVPKEDAKKDHVETDEQKKKPEEAEKKKKENGFLTAEPTVEPTAEPTVEPTAEPTAEPTSEPTAEPASEPTIEPTSEPTAEPTQESTPEVVDPEAGANFPLGTQCWEFKIDGHNEKSQKARDERCGKGLICARYTHDQGQGWFGLTTLGKADWRKECQIRGWGDDNCNSIGGKDKFRCSKDPGHKEVKICNVVNGSKSTAETCGCGTNICEKDEYCIIDHSGKNAEEKGNPCVAMCEETNGMKQTANKCMCSKPEYICEVNEVCFIRNETNKEKISTIISCEPAPQSEPPKESEQAEDDNSKDPAKADPQPPSSNADTPILLVGGHRR